MKLFIIIFYIIPTIVCIKGVVKECKEDHETVRTLVKYTLLSFLPILNALVTLYTLVDYLGLDRFTSKVKTFLDKKL